MEKKMNVLHICPSFNNDIYTQLVERQMAYGDKLRVFYFRAKGTGAPNGDRDYVDAVHPYRNMDRASFYYKEQKILRSFFSIYRNEYDLIHAHTLFSSGYIAYRAHQKWGTPYIVSVRATDLMPFFKYRVYLRGLGLDILKNAAKIVFLSPAHMQELFEKFIPASEKEALMAKSCLIPNGIDDYWFENRAQAKKRIASDTIRLIYYGDVNANKNLTTTIKACKLLQNEGKTVKFRVIGKLQDPKYAPLLENTPFVEYCEFMPHHELIRYLRESDVLVMPSKSETFGLSYVEAMTQGVPVIYTKGQGFDGQFPEGTVGYHVRAASAEEIAEKVKKILADYESFSANCVKNADRFQWDRIARQYRRLYTDIENSQKDE